MDAKERLWMRTVVGGMLAGSGLTGLFGLDMSPIINIAMVCLGINVLTFTYD